MNIPSLFRFLVLTATFLPFLGPSTLCAATASHPSLKPHPILMRVGISPLGSSLCYFQDGKDVNHYRDLFSIMEPLGDPPTLQLLKEARDADKWSWGFFVAGLGVGVVTAIVLDPTPVLGVDLLDRAATGSFWAQFFLIPGALFRFDAEGRKFNAVQRYNAQVRGEKSEVRMGPVLLREAHAIGWGIHLDL